MSVIIFCSLPSGRCHIHDSQAMAITNFNTENGTQKTLHNLLCSAGTVNSGIIHHSTYLSLLVIFVSIIAILGNALILVALCKETSLHPPSKLLLRCLTATDLCVGLIAAPIYAAFEMSLFHENWRICRYTFASSFIAGYILCAVSLLTLAAISVDRLLALLLGLRYRQVVTLKRTFVVVVAFWVVSTCAASTYFWNFSVTFSYGSTLISLCLVVSTYSYTRIFLILRRHQTQLQGDVHQQQPSQTIPLNLVRYRKAVYSAFWLQLTLLLCYLPAGIVEALLSRRSGHFSSAFLARRFSTPIVFLTSGR